MQTQLTIKPARSPIPGVIPEPVTVHDDAGAPHRRLVVTPPVRGRTRPTRRRRGRSDPTDTLLAGILSVMRDDKRRDPSSPKER
ncbi:MAG TPA: hypothetical protein VFU94_10990 [Conexibacter sp.]|nr:hypothetical protein [Conexibacter sp.]